MPVTLPRQFIHGGFTNMFGEASSHMLFLIPSADTVYNNAGTQISDFKSEDDPEDTSPESILEAQEAQRDNMQAAEEAEKEAQEAAENDEGDETSDEHLSQEASRVAEKDGTSKAAALEKLKDKQNEDKKLAEDKKATPKASTTTAVKDDKKDK